MLSECVRRRRGEGHRSTLGNVYGRICAMSATPLKFDSQRRGTAIVFTVVVCCITASGQNPSRSTDSTDDEAEAKANEFGAKAFTRCEGLYYSGPFDVDTVIVPGSRLTPGGLHGQLFVESHITNSRRPFEARIDSTVNPPNEWKGAIVLNSSESRERYRSGNDGGNWGNSKTQHPPVVAAFLLKRNGRWFASDARLTGYRNSLVASLPGNFDANMLITMFNTNLAGSKELLDVMAPWPAFDDLLKTIKPPSCGELFPRPVPPGQVTITSNPGFVHVTFDNAGERTQYTIMIGPDGKARQVSATINSPETNWSLEVRGPVNNDHLRTNIISVKKPGFNINPIYPDIPAQRRDYKKLVEDIETNADAAIKAAEDFRSHSRQGTYTPTPDSPGTFTTILPLPVPLNPDVAPETARVKAQMKAGNERAGPNGTPVAPTSGLVDISYVPITADGHRYLITLSADGKPINIGESNGSKINNTIIFDKAHPKGEVKVPDGATVDPETLKRLNSVVEKYITDHNLTP